MKSLRGQAEPGWFGLASTSFTGKCDLIAAYDSNKGGSDMSKKTIVVHCEFDPKGKQISEILEESFLLFLNRTVAVPQGKAVQCPR